MAGVNNDIQLTYDLCSDDLTDEGFEQGDFSSVPPQKTDASLTPLLRIQKYAQSGDIYDRHWVPKVLQDILRLAPADVLTKELPEIMKVFTKLADDGPLKLDILENIPSIAAQAVENNERVPNVEGIIGDYLIPLVLRNIGCVDSGVDKKAQSVLINLVKNGFVSKFQAEIKICPSILALTKLKSQIDLNTGAVVLMSKLTPHLGRDITERIILKRFIELCTSNLFYVRKLSASNFGYYCIVLGKEAFENVLLPAYLTLCEDEIWGIRKACAETMMYLSCVCSDDLRRNLLAPAFYKLLQDDCRWVRLSAFQYLGAFIATFAEPSLTKIDTNAGGDLILVNMEGYEYHPGGSDDSSLGIISSLKDEILQVDLSDLIGCSSSDLNRSYDSNFQLGQGRSQGASKKSFFHVDPVIEKTDETNTSSSSSSDSSNKISVDEENKQHKDDMLSYNEFNYWYISPTMLKIEDLDTKDDIVDLQIQVTNITNEIVAAANSLDNSDNTINDLLEIVKNIDVSHVDNEVTDEEKEPPQKVVPQYLLDSFKSMAQNDNNFNDNDMSFFCAYALPAVILTLGSENWPLLRDTMSILAGHVSYKIRRTIASCLHEIALILGSEIATEDLSPLFEGFLKDLEEVRIGILNHLFEFMGLLSPQKRALFLPKLDDFLRVENVCNWRFQETLAEQLTKCIPFFRTPDVVKYIGLYAQALMLYNVAAVREASLILVTEIVKHISKDHIVKLANISVTANYLSTIAERFAHSKKWKPRQTYANLCTEILKHDAMQPEEFASIMLPHLLDLCWDPVANVRLVVARCMVNYLMVKPYFTSCECECVDSLDTALTRLQTDQDVDVRMSAASALN